MLEFGPQNYKGIFSEFETISLSWNISRVIVKGITN